MISSIVYLNRITFVFPFFDTDKDLSSNKALTCFTAKAEYWGHSSIKLAEEEGIDYTQSGCNQ